LSDPNSAKNYCQNKFGIQNPSVLALGTIEPRKNLAMLIRAWKTSSLDLVIAGQDGWKMQDVENEILKLNQEQKTRFHRLPEITDEDKRQLLAAAEIVAVPSLDEGFGLVALEALQSGTNVVASNRGALPEVVGNAGVLLDPLDEKAWAQALTPGPSPIELSSTGEGNHIDQKFSWEKTAEVVLNGLRSLDKKSKRS
jgi:glycosyltransferase involved in cell wall biosynthesis